MEKCSLGIGLWMRKLLCSRCTKVIPGPLLHIQSWKIAERQKTFQKCTIFTCSHSSLKTNLLSGIYLTFVMAMTTVSVIMTVMVLNFFYRGPVLTEVPPWVRKWVGFQTIPLLSFKTRTFRHPVGLFQKKKLIEICPQNIHSTPQNQCLVTRKCFFGHFKPSPWKSTCK